MSWWKIAKPGDKVVCLRLPVTIEEGYTPIVRVGGIYTVEAIEPTRYTLSGVAVTLIEQTDGGWYNPELFRPVQTKSTETGMAILRKLLTGKRERVRP
jgi:hypothetical protein